MKGQRTPGRCEAPGTRPVRQDRGGSLKMTRGGPAVPFSPPELVKKRGEGPGRVRRHRITRPRPRQSPLPLAGGGGSAKLDGQKDKAAPSPESFRSPASRYPHFSDDSENLPEHRHGVKDYFPSIYVTVVPVADGPALETSMRIEITDAMVRAGEVRLSQIETLPPAYGVSEVVHCALAAAGFLVSEKSTCRR
jgi:hypothetical protein